MIAKNKNWDIDFPLDVLPERYQTLIKTAAEAFSVPPQIPAVALLVSTAACVGNVICVEAKPGWSEFANIFAVSVGSSADGKSPTARTITQPIHEIEDWRRQENAKSISEPSYQSFFAAFPEWNTVVVDDITLPALSSVFAANPRGLLWQRDELEGLFSEIKRNPVTKSRIRTGFDSGPWRVNRVNGDRTFHIPRATLSLAGTIQPRVLADVVTERDVASGFLPRFLFFRSNSDSPRCWTDAAYTPQFRDLLRAHYMKLLSIDYEIRPIRKPKTVQLTPDAKRNFIEFYNKISIRTWFTNPKVMDAFKIKLQTQTLRLALLLLVSDWTAGDVSTLNWVQAETMRRAIRLAEYFSRETRKVYEMIFKDASPMSPRKRRVAEAIVALAPNINAGLLSTQSITAACNQHLPAAFQLSSRQIGKTAKSLGLQTGQHMPGQSIRGVSVTPSDITRLRAML